VTRYNCIYQVERPPPPSQPNSLTRMTVGSPRCLIAAVRLPDAMKYALFLLLPLIGLAELQPSNLQVYTQLGIVALIVAELKGQFGNVDISAMPRMLVHKSLIEH
jgi:hypothetical protein